MSAKSATLSITSATYVAAPDFDAGAPFSALEAYLTSASVLAFSFDGVNDHGRLDSANFKSTARALQNSKYQKIWFRLVSGTSPGTGVVSAWT